MQFNEKTIKVCSFFGHRDTVITKNLKCKLKETIKNLIVNENARIFLFGSNSNFDYLAHLVVEELKQEYITLKRIAYTCRNETCILDSEKNKLEIINSTINSKVSLLCVLFED